MTAVACRGTVVMSVALSALVACANDPIFDEELCIPGEVVSCTCTDGAEGIQLCRINGRFDQCACSAASGDGGAGTGTRGPAEPDAGRQLPGETPPSGEPPAEPPTDENPPGQEPADPPAEEPPRDPPTEDPPTEDPPRSEPTPGDPAPDGALWGACRNGGDCRDGLECSGNNSTTFGGSPIGYCTEDCWTNSGQGTGNRRDCTSPTTGTVEAFCLAFTGLCELASCEHAQCPAGMFCQELQTPFGTSYECAYPPR